MSQKVVSSWKVLNPHFVRMRNLASNDAEGLECSPMRNSHCWLKERVRVSQRSKRYIDIATSSICGSSSAARSTCRMSTCRMITTQISKCGVKAVTERAQDQQRK